MHYKGPMVWIQPNKPVNIHQIAPRERANAAIYNNSVVAEANDDSIKIAFNYDIWEYSVDFRRTKLNISEGKILCDNQEWGDGFLTIYSFGDNYTCKMHWNEQLYPYECFFELHPMTK
jgi:hypothetical protein